MNQSALLTVFAVTTAAPAPPFDPASMFTGGLNGWLYNGAADQSEFLQSAGGAVCVDGDPLGSVEDLSGNASDILQATGGSKPVCKINGGIRSIYVTSSKLMEVTFASAMPALRTEVWVIKVMANTPSPAEAYPHVLSGGGGLDFQMIRNSATDVVEVWDGTLSDGSVTANAHGTPFIFVVKRATGLGPDVSAYTYNADGTAIDSDTGLAYHNTSTATSLSIGLATPQLPHHICFSMGIEGHPDLTDLLAYLADTFGAWSPT